MTTQLTTQLQALFAELDADVLENSLKWAEGRIKALREFKESDEYKAICRDAWTVYPKMYDICGGKTWFNVFNGNTIESAMAFVEKNCAATVESRNAKIAAKLEKAGVKTLENGEVVYNSDGFNGVYTIDTEQGRKIVKIDTIIAGGYNIQCRHLRVLVKIK
jgi:hypothetical protein